MYVFGLEENQSTSNQEPSYCEVRVLTDDTKVSDVHEVLFPLSLVDSMEFADVALWQLIAATTTFIWSVCRVTGLNPCFSWSIINLTVKSETGKWLWKALLSRKPRGPILVYLWPTVDADRKAGVKSIFLLWVIGRGLWVRRWCPWRVAEARYRQM